MENTGEIKKKVDNMIAKGNHEAKFKHIEHAKYMYNKLINGGIEAKLLEKFGHAHTLDGKAGEILSKHYHVFGDATGTAHRVLGKFV